MNRILFAFIVLLSVTSCKEEDLGLCDCVGKMTEIIEDAESYDEVCVYEVTLAREYPSCIRYTYECGKPPPFSDCPEEFVAFENAIASLSDNLGEYENPDGFRDCY